jgi:hypothetical protein
MNMRRVAALDFPEDGRLAVFRIATSIWFGALAVGCSAAGDAAGFSAATGGSASVGTGGAGGASLVVPPSGSGGGGVFVVPTQDGGTFEGGAPPPPPPSAPLQIDECVPANPAGLSTTAAQALMNGGPGSFRILYPYDGTVMPRGLIAPLLMWDGPSADAVYVHLQSSTFEYKGCFVPSGPNQLQLPQAIWDQATDHTGGASDPFRLELTVSSGGVATGPVGQALVVAKATLKGSIFYNSYTTKLLTGGLFGAGGAVLRIVPGKTAEVFLGTSGCNGCHSVSADGSRLVSLNLGSLTGGATYALTAGMAPNPPPLAATAPETPFSGLYPDGSFYVTNAHQAGVGPRAGGPGAIGGASAAVYDTNTGAAIANTGVPGTAMTPSFSPDGTLLTFTDYAIDGARGLAVMTFDGASRTASGYRKVYETAAPNYVAWPFVFPDNRAIVFAVGPTADFSGNGAGLGSGGLFGALNIAAPASDLFVADVAAGSATILAKAMGFLSEADAASNTTYLPFGAAEETHHNYYPTVSPVAAGGYFWVFYDSLRHYGNLGSSRQLWGTAVDISADGTYTVDPSHPAFYVTGQELGTGNHRAFTALDPCHKDGEACSTGIDCCGGSCTNGVCKPPPPPAMGPKCVRTDDSCASGLPCCDAHDRCIAGFCGTLLH